MSSEKNTVTVAAAQMCPQLGKMSENLAICLARLDEAAQNSAELIAFPELALSGYIYDSRDEAALIAESVPGPSTENVKAVLIQGATINFSHPNL